MKKSPLYTRTGDSGETSLVDGSRVPKHSPRLEAYGTLDELNSFIGAIAAASPSVDDADLSLIHNIQLALFDIGAYLATDPQKSPELSTRLLPQNLNEAIAEMESAIDRLHAAVPPVNTFILPAGAPAACACHIARTVARRAERRILLLDNVDPSVTGYVNRLSDYLFILARRANMIASIPDILWHPAQKKIH